MANTKVTGDLIASSTIATGNIADNAVTSDKISGITTAHITEGANLYYTDARARGAVSVSGNALSYNSSTGVITSNFEESPTFTGNVGIGAAASDGNLHVRKTGINTGITNVLMNANFADGSNGTGLSIGYRTDETTAVLAARTATGNIAFYSYDGGWSESMRIKNNGNVGIGTASPFSSAKLQVKTDTNRNVAIQTGTAHTTGIKINAFNDAANTNIPLELNGSLLSLKTGETERIHIDSSGNVGIGKSQSGNATLTVKSMAGSNTGLMLIEGDTTNDGHGLYATTDNKFVITRFTNGSYSDNFVMDSSGRVGIGTTSPNTKLDVVTSGASENVIQLRNATQTLALGVNNNSGGAFLFTNTNHALRFGCNGSEVGRFSNIGNLGIGTTSPGNKLTIASGTGGGSQPDSRTLLHIDKDGEAYISINSPAESFNGIRLNVAGTPKAFMELYDNTAQGKKLNIGTVDARNLVFDTGNTERIRITSGGDVGIGTADGPDDVNSRLHVYKNAAASTVVELLRLDCGENNHAAGKGGSIIWRDINVYSNTASITAQRTGNGSSSSLQFGLRGAEKMRIDSSGKVGIGTASIPNPFSGAYSNILQVGTTGGNTRLAITAGSTGSSDLNFADSNDSTNVGSYVGAISYKHNGDYMLFSTNGSEKMRINSTGSVGIGTTSPNDKLEVSGGNIRIYSTNNANHLIIKNNATGTSGVFEERIKFLGWNDTDQAAIIAMGNAYFGQPVNALAFQVSGSEKMRITHGGDVLFGTTSTTSYPTLNNFVHINEVSGVSVVIGGHSGAHTAVQFRHNGASAVGSIVITASSTSYNTSSDYRLKENVIEMTGALDRVSQLKPSRFNFIADADTTVDGFLAHEVQEIVPEAISGEKDAVDEDGNPEYQGIDQSKLVPLLVSAIQELKAEIETLKTQINN